MLIAVDVGRGLVVWHTRTEWEALMRGVDVEAAEQHAAEIELELEEGGGGDGQEAQDQD